jgi:hypothetical protein
MELGHAFSAPVFYASLVLNVFDFFVAQIFFSWEGRGDTLAFERGGGGANSDEGTDTLILLNTV